jgi:hypothetical protein
VRHGALFPPTLLGEPKEDIQSQVNFVNFNVNLFLVKV